MSKPETSSSPALPGGEGREPTTREPYRIWKEWMPFRKNGSPVVGNMGSSGASVVIIRADVFQRMLREHPTLMASTFEMPTDD